MDDYSLVQVDHQPNFENVSFVPVDHNPFSDDGVAQQAPAQLAQIPLQSPQTQPQVQQAQFQQPQTQAHPAQPTQAQPQPAQPQAQQPATGTGQLGVNGLATGNRAGGSSGGAGVGNAGIDPGNPTWLPGGPGEAVPLSPEAADIASKVAYGMMRQGAALPQRLIDAARVSAEHNYGPGPRTISDSDVWVDPLPAVAAETALMMAGPGSLMAERGAAGALGGKLRSPASRAAEKGYSGVGTTPNGGPTFVGTDHLYPAAEGQRSVVRVKLTGSRKKDRELANEEGGFANKPEGYIWHHIDDFDPQTGESSLELVKEGAHVATYPHAGSVAQYVKHHGIRYKR